MKYKLPERLKELRLERKLTMEQLEAKSGLNQSSIQAWESGRATPTAINIIILADFFGVTADYLLGRTDN